MVGLLAGGLLAAMLPGVASAEPNPKSINHENVFGKATEDPECVVVWFAIGHWDKSFNPSQVNRYLRVNGCTRVVGVWAGARPLD
jgi:hypothetical protein